MTPEDCNNLRNLFSRAFTAPEHQMHNEMVRDLLQDYTENTDLWDARKDAPTNKKSNPL